MLEQICGYIHNWFEYDKMTRRRLVHVGFYRIQGGTISLPFMAVGQYFRIVGSKLNDGIYQYPARDMVDEDFTGEIWEMMVPRDVLALADEIGEWVKKYGEQSLSPYTSESFGGYTYSKAAQGGTGSDGTGAASWQGVFKSRLNQYRKLG